MKSGIDTLHPAVKILIMILPAILIGAGYYYFMYIPKTEEITKLKGDISNLEKEIKKAEFKVKRLPEVKAQYEEMKREFERLKKQLPEEKEVSDLLKHVSDLGIETGLKVLLWKPMSRITHSSGLVYEIPVNVSMRGYYHNLGVFFSKLTGLKRVVNIKNISLGGAAPEKSQALINIKFHAVTYSAIEGDSATAGSQKGRRRGRK